MVKVLAIIPARGDSKSIPKKNILDFNGHPLIAYTIAVAKLSKEIDRVIVTTDSQEIADIAKKYGAEVPFLRPREISGDKAMDIDFFKHTLKWLSDNEGYVPDLIVHLRPITPCRKVEVVDEAIRTLPGDATALRSADLSLQPAHKLFRINDGFCEFYGKSDGLEGEYYNLPRQELPKSYRPNGYVDIIRPVVITGSILHGDKVMAFITDRTADIDHAEDVSEAIELLNTEE